jgi:hypothetical protein
MTAEREADTRALHCGVVLQDDRRAALVARWADRHDRDVSIYADPRARPLPEVRAYDDDELLASFGFVAADAVAQLRVAQAGQRRSMEELAERYSRLLARVVVGAGQVTQGAESVLP